MVWADRLPRSPEGRTLRRFPLGAFPPTSGAVLAGYVLRSRSHAPLKLMGCAKPPSRSAGPPVPVGECTLSPALGRRLQRLAVPVLGLSPRSPGAPPGRLPHQISRERVPSPSAGKPLASDDIAGPWQGCSGVGPLPALCACAPSGLSQAGGRNDTCRDACSLDGTEGLQGYWHAELKGRWVVLALKPASCTPTPLKSADPSPGVRVGD